MAAGNMEPYDTGAKVLLENDWEADAFYAILLSNSYTPSDADTQYSNVSSYETSDVDYSPQALASKTITNNGADNYVDSSDVSFGNPVSISARYFVILKGTAATPNAADELVMYCDLNSGGSEVSSTNSEFTVQAPTNGWIKVTHS